MNMALRPYCKCHMQIVSVKKCINFVLISLVIIIVMCTIIYNSQATDNRF